MLWSDIEKSFNRALWLSFSKRKIALTFPILVLCGIFLVFCRAIALEAGNWIALSAGFLPIFLSSGVLLGLGVILIRMYDSEVKHVSFHLKKWLVTSSDLLIGTSYLSVPSVLAYLCLWIVLGIFFLLKEIPLIGDFFSVVLSFAPFLILFSSLLLCVFNLGLLFFVTPVASLQSARNISLAKKVLDLLKMRTFSALILFILGIVPVAIVTLLLTTAAALTNLSFSVAERSLSVALEWFFIMLPFSAVLTPAVIFFFNFAAESHRLLQGNLAKAASPLSPLEKREEKQQQPR